MVDQQDRLAALIQQLRRRSTAPGGQSMETTMAQHEAGLQADALVELVAEVRRLRDENATLTAYQTDANLLIVQLRKRATEARECLRVEAGGAVTTELLPIENMALTVALAQVLRGDDPPPNTAATCVLALARLTGRHDWTDTEMGQE